MHLHCTRCGLHRTRRNIVVGRGSIPADIVMIGEAPGKSEDMLCSPFIGASGNMLNQTVESVCKLIQEPLPSIYITNTVLCRPCDESIGPNRAPTREEIETCRQNLLRIVRIVKPKYVILIGNVARDNCRTLFRPECVSTIVHPAYLLRTGGYTSGHYAKFRRDILTAFKHVKEMMHGKEESEESDSSETETETVFRRGVTGGAPARRKRRT